MTRDVKPECLLFMLEFQSFCPWLGWIGSLLAITRTGHHPEQASLTDFALTLLFLSPIDCAIDVCVQNGTIAVNRVESSCFDQAFNHSLVYRSKIDSLTKVKKRFKRFVRHD